MTPSTGNASVISQPTLGHIPGFPSTLLSTVPGASQSGLGQVPALSHMPVSAANARSASGQVLPSIMPASSFTSQPGAGVPGMPASTSIAGPQRSLMEDMQYNLLLQSMLLPSMNLLNQTLVRFGVNPSSVASSTLSNPSSAGLSFPTPVSAAPSQQQQQQQQQIAHLQERQQQLGQSRGVAFSHLSQQQCQPESLQLGGSSPCKSSEQGQGQLQDRATESGSPARWLQQQYVPPQSQVRQDVLQSTLSQSGMAQQHSQSYSPALRQQQQQLQQAASQSNARVLNRAQGPAENIRPPLPGGVTPDFYPVVDQLPALEGLSTQGQGQGFEAVLLSDLVPLLTLGAEEPGPPS